MVDRCSRNESTEGGGAVGGNSTILPVGDGGQDLITQAPKRFDSHLEVGDVLAGKPEHSGAGCGTFAPEIEDLFDLLERKAEGLRTFDEPELVKRASSVPPVPGCRTQRRCQNAHLLVEADRLRLDASLFSQFTDEQTFHTATLYLSVD